MKIKMLRDWWQIRHLLVSPKLKVKVGLWRNMGLQPFYWDKEVRLFEDHQCMLDKKLEFQPEFKKKLKRFGLGWLKPLYILPEWLHFGFYNEENHCKWKYDVPRYEYRGHLTLVVFGIAFSLLIEPPESEDEHCHEDSWYEFIEAYVNGFFHDDLIKTIKDFGYSTSYTKDMTTRYRTIDRRWFRDDFKTAYDLAYAELDVETDALVGHDKQEYILCSAIKRVEKREFETPPYWEGTNDICNIELGYRHHDIYRRFNEEVSSNMTAQGFYTSYGRFVGREEAAKIAFAAGQIKEMKKQLFSEDLY